MVRSSPWWLQKYNRDYYAVNGDRMRAAFRGRDKSLRKAEGAAYYKKNKARLSQRAAAYRKSHRSVCRASEHRHRLRKKYAKVASIRVTGIHLDQRAEVFGNQCAYCGGPHQHMDHVKALALGGPHTPANLRPSCKSCNSRKHSKHWRAWLSTIPKPEPIPLP